MSEDDLRCFVLIVGNARSGSTLLGAVIDAHPDAMVANETAASVSFWQGMDGPAILGEVRRNAQRMRVADRPSAGYHYRIGGECARASVQVMGDKIWNPATLLLHGDHALLGRLEAALGMPVKIVHAVRNPFDVVATMHRRSGAPIADRIAWYFMHCDAVQAIRANRPSEGYTDVHHEALLSAPEAGIAALCRFLGLEVVAAHVAACQEMFFAQPRLTRQDVRWENAEIRLIVDGIHRYPFLARYAQEDYTTLARR